MNLVQPEEWESTVTHAHANGFRYFDWLGCVDEVGRADTFRLVLMLRNPELPAAEPLLLGTEVPRADPRLPSIAVVFPGAGWHEREAAELFGVRFVGGDGRRLLLDANYVGTPLRKDEVLAARSAVVWPGAKEPGEAKSPAGPNRSQRGAAASAGRRRMAPPGVPDPEVFGARDPELPSADPAEIAASAAGGRVRRRRR